MREWTLEYSQNRFIKKRNRNKVGACFAYLLHRDGETLVMYTWFRYP